MDERRQEVRYRITPFRTGDVLDDDERDGDEAQMTTQEDGHDD